MDKFVKAITNDHWGCSTGWITGSGEILTVPNYGHLFAAMEYLKDSKGDNISVDLYRKFLEIKNRLDGIENECNELHKRDGWGEWHAYEMAQDSAQDEIYEALLSAGWARIYFDKQKAELTVEARPVVIKNHFDMINRLANRISEDIFALTKNVHVNWERKKAPKRKKI